MFRQCSQTRDVTLGVSWAGLGVRLDDSDVSLPSQHILSFYDSAKTDS